MDTRMNTEKADKRHDILVVDDEPDIRKLVKDILEDEGYAVRVAGNGLEARAALAKQSPDLMLLDIWMPDEDGITLLKSCRVAEHSEYPVIMMSGHGTIETAIEAMRFGADNFIEKPLTTDKLLRSVRKILGASDDEAEATPSITIARAISGQSEAASALRETVSALAAGDDPILVCGAAGVGKRAFAAQVHACSARASAPFITTHLGDVSAQDRSSGALIKNLKNAIAQAVGGTLFIRHIEHLPAAAARYVRGLPADIRLMASCYTPSGVLAIFPENRNKPHIVDVPKLQQRIEDLPELLRTGIDYVCQEDGMTYRHFSIAAQNRLLNYDWPENLRELDDMVRKFLRTGEQTEISLLEVERVLAAKSPMTSDWFKTLLACPLREARERFEKAYLENALREVSGNVSMLAEKTGMERRHLYRKLRALSISPRRK